MTLQNRVTPLGEIVATPERGLVYGNRGCLHDAGRRIRRQFQGTRWIACRLEFRGRHRADPMQPGRYTGLFFLDEATAFAAGHRPCAECRREDYNRFMEIVGERRAGDVDERLHAERLGPRRQARIDELPDGAFVLVEGEPWLVLGRELLRWTPGGYAGRRAHAGRAPVVTPATSVEALRAGWSGAVPFLHPSASRRS
ncbi:MAG: hypothetical protein KGI93_01725 [Acidobacteriota bacterium]|nr:hypothetical protein [Acidobacteriota bacterium]